MDFDFSQLLMSMLEQGPLVGYLFYQNWRADKKAEIQETRIKDLYNELLTKQEGYLSKTFETIASNTNALTSLKDVITVKNNG